MTICTAVVIVILTVAAVRGGARELAGVPGAWVSQGGPNTLKLGLNTLRGTVWVVGGIIGTVLFAVLFIQPGRDITDDGVIEEYVSYEARPRDYD
jgi:hypothetical protein